MNLIANMSLDELIEAMLHTPRFIHESLDSDEGMYRPDTKQYCIRGLNFATIQIDQDDPEETMITTMHNGCSFYEQYVYLNDIRAEFNRRTFGDLDQAEQYISSLTAVSYIG